VGPDVSRPIYDQPDHPSYGPVRRLHVMLLQLAADVSLDAVMSHYKEVCMAPWDAHLDFLLQGLGYCEAEAQRRVLQDLLFSISMVSR
jgi:hypothetical protein